MDANGDGIGDFQGLMRRLDYLHGLGVTAIWLMPFQKSPCKDDGYDVSDYYAVDPRYGTLGDFVEFSHAAKQRGIRVLIDLVVNHTSNAHVQAEILKIMGFWIQLGVSGFRMDAVPFIIGTKGAKVRKPVEQYDMLRNLREFLQWRLGDSIILAEANVLPDTDMEYFGDEGERMQMMFNFQVNQNLFFALAAADSRPLVKALKATKPRPATAQWGLFLRNHDELDFGRLSDAQPEKVFAVLGPDP